MSIRNYLPELERHFSLLGQITYLWNTVEFEMDMLIGSFILTDDGENKRVPNSRAVHNLIAKLPNRDRVVMLRYMANQFPLGPELDERVEAITPAFSILNENRNALVHSRFIYAGKPSMVTWMKPSRSPGKAAHSVASLRTLQGQVATLERFNRHLDRMQSAVHSRRHNWTQKSRWPAKFPLPHKLEQPDPLVLRNLSPLPSTRIKKSRD